MTAPARSMRTSLVCTIKKQPGTLTVVEPAHAGVKAEKAAGVVVTADAPDFVALWASSAVAAEVSSFRLDLRCDVVDLLVASKPPATSAKVALSKERVAQGHLGPCAGSFVATFDSTEQRQTFVDAVKYWRLGATEAAALRALAAASAASQGPDADAAASAEGTSGGGATLTIDSKELVMAGSARVKAEEDAAHSGGGMPTGVEIIGVAQRARERAWVRHDATLRQLFDALVTSGVITEDEFASAHAEEKAAFFSEVPEVNQRLGLDSLSDALSDIVDPDTHQLRPVTEQVAANIFAQSPALASVYRQRVQTSEDEMVFWDAVIRRVLFLSRTLLDKYDATATKKEDADTVTTGGSNAADTVSSSWNERSEAALRLLEAERGAAVGKRIVRPAGSASDAAEDARQRRAVGRHRREAGDAEATGGLGGNGVIELDRDALFAHARMSDLETAAGPPRGNAASAQREGSDTERDESGDEAYWTSRLEESFGTSGSSFRPGGTGGLQTSFRLTSAEDRAAHGAAVTAVCASFEAALAEREAAPAVDHGGLWEGMMRVQPAIDLFALWGANSTMADSVRAKKASAVPLQLRTCHSLHRLFFRQLLACQAQARALQAVPPSAAEAAARARCGEVLDALKRARAKAFADPPEGVDEAARDGPWATGTRKVDHLVAKADAAFADAKEQWGA